MSEIIKQLKGPFGYERDKLKHASNLFKESMTKLNTEIKDRDEEKYIFEPRELKTLIDSLGAELFMVTVEGFLKKSNEVMKELDLLEDMEEIYKCPYADECINCTNHCMRYTERLGEEGKEQCFNFKAKKEEPKKVEKVYDKTEEDLREFIKTSLDKNPKLIKKSHPIKMHIGRSYPNIDKEIREGILIQIVGEYAAVNENDIV